MKKKLKKQVKKVSKTKKSKSSKKVKVIKKKSLPKNKAVAKKKTISKKVKAPKVKPEKPIGVVTHFYNHIKVAVVKFKEPVKVGVKVMFKGATTNFAQVISSMQYEHEAIKIAKKGQSLGLKVAKRVREGDEIFIQK